MVLSNKNNPAMRFFTVVGFDFLMLKRLWQIALEGLPFISKDLLNCHWDFMEEEYKTDGLRNEHHVLPPKYRK